MYFCTGEAAESYPRGGTEPGETVSSSGADWCMAYCDRMVVCASTVCVSEVLLGFVLRVGCSGL